MSIRTNPMKAVPVLLKRVKRAKSKFMERERDESLDGKLEKLTWELNKIEDVFMKVKRNQDALLDTLHEVDSHLRKLDRKRLNEDMDDICKRIRVCTHKLLPMETFDDESSDEKSGEIVQSSHDPSSTQPNNQVLLRQPQHVNLNLEMLTSQLRNCLRCLSIFPEDAVIEKRQVIYWWIGVGIIDNTGEKTAEEVGEDVIDEFLELNLILACGNGKCSHAKKFKLNPLLYQKLKHHYPEDRENTQKLRFYCLSQMPERLSIWFALKDKKDTQHMFSWLTIIFNVGVSHLKFRSQQFSQIKHLQVLQLGRWQDSPSHHIEVESEEFLKELRLLTELRYLSLRGILIYELPASIAQNESLQILDLKACHNLETLPDDVSSMKSLTHLILSQCYMLDGMPKGINKLTNLQVLKGFIVGSPGKTPSTISDFARLRELRRLSIHIATEAVINDGDFKSLGKLSALEHLKISWGVSDIKYSDIQIILPWRLKKLHLQGFRGQRIPEWLKPSKLPGEFEELNITGGKLANMNHNEDVKQWDVKIVRLKYLKHLDIDLINLKMLFPKLRYALIKPIPNHSYIEWSIDWK